MPLDGEDAPYDGERVGSGAEKGQPADEKGGDDDRAKAQDGDGLGEKRVVAAYAAGEQVAEEGGREV